MIEIPYSGPKTAQAWQALLAISAVMEHGWTIIGGQMVHLHCAERGITPSRATDDLDAGIDIRGDSTSLATFTEHLHRAGFKPVNTAEGLHHRWINADGAQFDVLIPTGTGERLSRVLGFMGSPTVASPGTQQALDRSERVQVRLFDGTVGYVNRPSLLGALVIKAAAYGTSTPNRDRHLIDFITLATLVRGPSDLTGITRRDEQRLRARIQTIQQRPELTALIDGGAPALARLDALIEQSAARRQRPSAPSRPRPDGSAPAQWSHPKGLAPPCPAVLEGFVGARPVKTKCRLRSDHVETGIPHDFGKRGRSNSDGGPASPL